MPRYCVMSAWRTILSPSNQLCPTMEGYMRQHLLAVALAATFGSVECVAAQEVGDAPAVPTAKAPYHVPAFQNDYVTLLNVYIPPGRNTGYHAHTLDMLTVIVEDADTTAQTPGRSPNP